MPPAAGRADQNPSAARTRREFEELVPGHGMGVLIIDGARAGRQSPKDKNVREASIGGRRNIPSRYALACTGKIGGALWLGKAKQKRLNCHHCCAGQSSDVPPSFGLF